MVTWRYAGLHTLGLGLLLGLCRAQNIPLQQEPVVKFGTTVVLPFGLRGDIFLLPEGTVHLPDFATLEPVGSIYTSSLNVPPSNFKQGFPGVTKRYEWFAIDYNGKFWIEKPGKYIFGLISDDGSQLYIDGALKADNDGIHLPKEVTAAVKLKGGIHTIRVTYFQGPCRSDPCLALQLGVKVSGAPWKIFSTDDFRPPPNPEDWKFAPSQVEPPRSKRRQ